MAIFRLMNWQTHIFFSFQLYNSLWVLDCSIISFHFFLSCVLCFQLFTPIFLKSFLTSSSHLTLRLPFGLVAYGFHLYMVLATLSLVILSTCPNQLNHTTIHTHTKRCVFETRVYLVWLNLKSLVCLHLIFPLGLLIISFIAMWECPWTCWSHRCERLQIAAQTSLHNCRAGDVAATWRRIAFYGVLYLFMFGLKLVIQLYLDLSVYVHVQSLKITC